MTVSNNEPDIEIRKIEPGDRLTGLSLGEEFTPLKIFLQRHAKKYHETGLARTYAAFDLLNKGKILGYVTLVCGEIVLEDEDDRLLCGEGVDYHYKHYPAVKIARLAVDRRCRGSGLGSHLVNLALGVTKSVICPAVGCRFIVVDSKRAAVAFYEKCGFTILDTATNRARMEPVLFVDLHKTPA